MILQTGKNWMDNERPYGVGDVVIVTDDHLNVVCWPLSVLKHVITSSDGLVKMINVRTAKGVLTRDGHCVGFLDDDEVVIDASVSEIGR